MMSKSDFQFAIQIILDEALASGWTIEEVQNEGVTAAEDWYEEEVLQERLAAFKRGDIS